MTTVAARTFASTPARDAADTWRVIVDVLDGGRTSAARAELLSVTGVAAAIVADGWPSEAAIIVTCDGPRTRVYCAYDDDAIDGSGVNEDALGFDALKGNWAVSLPCDAEDLPWVQGALAKLSLRVTARDRAAGTVTAAATAATGGMSIDPSGFLGS